MIVANNALVTGYDFLLDSAHSIEQQFMAKGIPVDGTLINDTWTDTDLNNKLFNNPGANFNLISLNAHFEHYRLFPFPPGTQNLATEVVPTVSYSGVLVFTVGCHSGLTAPDNATTDPIRATEWAQAFARRGATFVGNLGFGYGDSTLVNYSERLSTLFAEELTAGSAGKKVPIGDALRRAKLEY